MSQHVVTEIVERVARIVLSRPEKKNALTLEMYGAMSDALEQAEADSEVRAILLHGQPDCFCSGNDLKDFLERPPSDDESPPFRFLRRIATLGKPIVAAVGGPAVGIGTTMLLHCDLVYVAPSARLQLPFVPLGLVPEAGSTLLLPRIAGYPRAAELLLLGQPFDAEKALSAGIATAVVPEAELLERALAAARALAALPPAPLRMTKELMKRAEAPAVLERMAEEFRLFGERLASPEAAEALAAFFEKRKPDFSRFS
jgi:enoyl-CoA hydratase/carnithine racemase